jgi:hypothetical protein
MTTNGMKDFDKSRKGAKRSVPKTMFLGIKDVNLTFRNKKVEKSKQH